MDETGSRHPDRKPPQAGHGYDWFAIGGILINAEEEEAAKQLYADFLKRWPQVQHPLHLTDIRAEKKGFAWLGRLSDEERSRFLLDLRTFLGNVPVAGTACVIDRPGYYERGYAKRYGDEKWKLCRSAFDIVVERAAKYAKLNGRRLKVFYERADPVTDAQIEGYFQNLKTNGLGFDTGTSAKYAPFSAADFGETLVGIEGKDKRNKMMQVADSYVYSIARGSYDRKFDFFRRIFEKGRLVTTQVDIALAPTLGIKRYCFDLVDAARTNKKGRD
nr:DUF3800 domain-containing protein [Microvirga calopogonii]